MSSSRVRVDGPRRGGESSKTKLEENRERSRELKRDLEEVDDEEESSDSEDEDDDEEEFEEDADLSEELHPIGYYINDREEMINQVFSVIKGAKLRAMLTSGLKDVNLLELKQLCLEQLEGMSKKRIKFILAGKEMEESSNTEDDDDDADAHLDELFKGKLNAKRKTEAVVETKGVELKADSESDDEDGFHKSSKRKKKIVAEPPKKHKLNVRLNNKKKPFSKAADSDKKKKQEGEKQVAGAGGLEAGKGQTLMALLELEYRARAIKALLNKESAGQSKSTADPGEPPPVASEKQIQLQMKKMKKGSAEGTAENVEAEEVDEEDRDELKAMAAKEKHLQKAREALMVSEGKQREEEDKKEKQQEEIARKLEEQKRKKEEEEERIKRKKEEEEEKERLKKKKAEDQEKFLKWKEERRKTEELKRKLEEEVELDMAEERAKRNLRELEQKMKAKEEEERGASKTTAAVDEDELDLDYGSPIESDDDRKKADKEEGGNDKRRKYRRKVSEEADDRGEKDLESVSEASSRSRSRSPSSISLSSLSSEGAQEDKMVEKLRLVRGLRVEEIRRQRRKRKPAQEIEEGEVDSEGEHFEPIEQEDKERQQVVHEEEDEEEEGEGDDEGLDKYDLFAVDTSATSLVQAEKEPVGAGKGDPEQQQVNLVEHKEVVPAPSRKDVGTKQVAVVKRNKKSKKKQVLIKDDSDNEKILTSEEDSEEDIAAEEGGKKAQLRSKQKSGRKNEEAPEQNTIEVSDAGKDLEVQDAEEVETEEDRLARERNEREDQKRQEKMERLREERIKRIQAFQQKTGIQEVEDCEVVLPQDDVEEGVEVDKDGSGQEKEKSDFYKSFFEEETKLAETEKLKKENEKSQEVAAESLPEKQGGASPKPVPIKSKKPKKAKEKSKEEKMLEGVGFWSRLCESQGDFEVPNASSAEATESAAPVAGGSTLMEAEEEAPPAAASATVTNFTKKKSTFASKRPTRSSARNRDLPTKDEVDRDQRELEENLTWQDRWYQNKKVQKVVKDSKIMSKVRTQIKLKDFKLNDPEAAGSSSSAGSDDRRRKEAPTNEELPKIIGSMEEYAKIIGKPAVDGDEDRDGAEDAEKVSEEESENEEDELWGAIMGGEK